MIKVMVKHAGSNSDAHVVEHCRVGSEAVANAIALKLMAEKMPAYEYSPRFMRNPRFRLVDRYSRVYTEKVSSAGAPSGMSAYSLPNGEGTGGCSESCAPAPVPLSRVPALSTT